MEDTLEVPVYTIWQLALVQIFGWNASAEEKTVDDLEMLALVKRFTWWQLLWKYCTLS